MAGRSARDASAPTLKDAPAALDRQRIAHARAWIAAREQRDAVFGKDLFADPAWNMLIGLYASGKDGQIAVSALCSASGVPHATALRWLGALEKRDLAVRIPDATDGRRMFVVLTDSARQGIEAVLDRWMEEQGSGASNR